MQFYSIDGIFQSATHKIQSCKLIFKILLKLSTFSFLSVPLYKELLYILKSAYGLMTLPQTSKKSEVTHLPFSSRVPAANCPHSEMACPSSHLVIKPSLHTVGAQVSICLSNHCQQFYIIGCQGCFKELCTASSRCIYQVFLCLQQTLPLQHREISNVKSVPKVAFQLTMKHGTSQCTFFPPTLTDRHSQLD